MRNGTQIIRDDFDAFARGKREVIERSLALDFTFSSPRDDHFDLTSIETDRQHNSTCRCTTAEGKSAHDWIERRRIAGNRAMATLVEEGEVPGVVTLVSRGEEVHVGAAGTMAFGSDKPLMRNTIFRIASMTKPVTGAAAMLLVEDGKLALDEPVDRLLPELATPRVLTRLDAPLDDTVPAKRPILVSDLLTLRMGTGAIMTPGKFPINDAMDKLGTGVGAELPDNIGADEWLARLGSLPLMHQPGDVWMYDTGLTVLGALIARAAGEPLEDFMRRRLFAPLGMADTGFCVPAKDVERLPACHSRSRSDGTWSVSDAGGAESRFSRPRAFPSASGGLVATVDDYLRFARMMLQQGELGGKRILSRQSVAAMTRDHLTGEQKRNSPFVPGFWDTNGWGLGVGIRKNAAPADARGFGWDGGYGTSGYWDPESGLIGIVMTQVLWNSPEPPRARSAFWKYASKAVRSGIGPKSAERFSDKSDARTNR